VPPSTATGWARRAKQALALAAAVPVSLIWRRQSDACFRDDVVVDTGPESFVAKLVLRLAALDWLLLGYLLTLLYAVAYGGGPRRGMAIIGLLLDLVVFAGALALVRRNRRAPSNLYALVYRFAVLVALLGSFLELQWILPTASGPAVDAVLYNFDLRVFGIEPAQALERYATSRTTEWFAFFYYGYFIIVAAHVFPALFLGKDQRFMTSFGFGFVWLYCVGHIAYTVMPAYGPYAHLTFRHPLEGDLWWPLVKRTVASVDGSARTDVFPSLHTAGPTFLALYSFRRRSVAPFKYTWPALAFSASQIIVATMFLRWHYLVDICAGLLLACSGIVAGSVACWWDDARVAAGGSFAWPELALRARQRTASIRASRFSSDAGLS
jgi:hypothetical protein